MIPLTNAPVVEIELGGKKYTLLFGFRCCKKIGINPFDDASREEYFGNLTIDKAAEFISAAVENWWAFATLSQPGEPTPDILTPDNVIDLLDMRTFADIVAKLKTASDQMAGTTPAEAQPTTEPTANPQAA